MNPKLCKCLCSQRDVTLRISHCLRLLFIAFDVRPSIVSACHILFSWGIRFALDYHIFLCRNEFQLSCLNCTFTSFKLSSNWLFVLQTKRQCPRVNASQMHTKRTYWRQANESQCVNRCKKRYRVHHLKWIDIEMYAKMRTECDEIIIHVDMIIDNNGFTWRLRRLFSRTMWLPLTHSIVLHNFGIDDDQMMRKKRIFKWKEMNKTSGKILIKENVVEKRFPRRTQLFENETKKGARTSNVRGLWKSQANREKPPVDMTM